MLVTILQDCSFNSFASAVWLTNCAQSNFFNTVGSGTSIIGPIGNIFPSTYMGTYLQNSNTFILRGAEVKTFKTNTANVCSARLNYRVYPQASVPGPFTVLDLPFFENCTAGTFPSGGPCNVGDQKWQKVLTDAESPLNLTAYPAGNYVIEVFYDLTGDVNSTSQCDDTVFINNGGNNFIATYSIQENPTYTISNPTVCNTADGSISIAGLTPNTSYSLSYTYNTIPVGPITIVSGGATGNYVIDSLLAGTYANFSFTVNSCTINSTDVLVLENPILSPAFDPIGPFCLGQTVPALPLTSVNGITGTWNPPSIDNTQTVTYQFTADPNQCATDTSLTITVNQPQVVPTFSVASNITACQGFSAQVLIPTTSNEGYTGTWNPSTLDYSILGTTIYTFTPDVGECCLIATITVVVNPNITPTFNTVGPICNGDVINPLPTTSLEGVVGNWTPAINNLATTTYTFTPTPPIGPLPTNLITNGDFSNGNTGFTSDYSFITNAGVNGVQRAYGIVTSANSWFQFFPACLSNAPSGGNMMVADGSSINGGNDIVWGQTVNVEPNKNYIFSYWLQTVATPNLASIEVTINNVSIGISTAPSNNCETTQYSYTWNSGSNSTAQIAIYDRITIANGNDFSLDDISLKESASIQCATTTTLTVVVNQPIPSTFGTIPAICSGDSAPTLPATSIEGYTGTWNPAVSNTETLTYTFTPTAGQCASGGTITLTVNQPVTATFNPIGDLCNGQTAPSLPITSIEGFTGTWIPAIIDNINSGTYVFTPDANQCASSGNLSVNVQSGFDFDIAGNCVGNDFTLEVFPVNGSFDIATSNFNWENSNSQSVGTNSSTFNVTEYLASTSVVEDLPIRFYVTVTTADGCFIKEFKDFDSVTCLIQKGISPNNDGDNDFFDLESLGVKNLGIYNRYGMKVYSKGLYTNQWYGQSDSGEELPDGTYYYVIEFISGSSTKTGWIYINREVK